MHPNFFNQLVLFVTAAKAGSFSATAQATGRAHNVVSYGILNLETFLGVTLFDRSGHRAELTSTGHALLREAQTMVDTATAFQKKAQELSAGLENYLTIAIDELISISTIEAALATVSDSYQGVEIRLVRTGANGALAMVREGKAVFGLGTELTQIGPELDMILLGKVTMTPVIATTLKETAGQGERAEPASLRQIVLSGAEGPEASPDHGVFSPRIWRVSDLTTKLNLISTGLGWGMMPEHMVTSALATKILSRLPLGQLAAMPQVPIIIFNRSDTPLGPAGQLFLKSFSQPSIPT